MRNVPGAAKKRLFNLLFSCVGSGKSVLRLQFAWIASSVRLFFTRPILIDAHKPFVIRKSTHFLCGIVKKVDQGQLKEGLISVGSTRSEEPDPLEPEIIQRLDNKFKYRDMPKDYYMDEDGDEVRYIQRLRRGKFPRSLRLALTCSVAS